MKNLIVGSTLEIDKIREFLLGGVKKSIEMKASKEACDRGFATPETISFVWRDYKLDIYVLGKFQETLTTHGIEDIIASYIKVFRL